MIGKMIGKSDRIRSIVKYFRVGSSSCTILMCAELGNPSQYGRWVIGLQQSK